MASCSFFSFFFFKCVSLCFLFSSFTFQFCYWLFNIHILQCLFSTFLHLKRQIMFVFFRSLVLMVCFVLEVIYSISLPSCSILVSGKQFWYKLLITLLAIKFICCSLGMVARLLLFELCALSLFLVFTCLFLFGNSCKVVLLY